METSTVNRLQAAGAGGCSIAPMTTGYQFDEELRAVSALRTTGFDGVVPVMSNPQASTALRQLQADGLRYVFAYSRDKQQSCVSIDSVAAVARLAALGHHRIAMVSGQRAASGRAQLRYHGVVRRDLRVVGFDGIALGKDLTPPLTTISQPNHDIGRTSVELPRLSPRRVMRRGAERIQFFTPLTPGDRACHVSSSTSFEPA